MSTKRHQEVALLFVGALFSSPEIYHATVPVLRDQFGTVLFESPDIPWDHSPYYSDELGLPISRRFIFFERPVDASLLPGIKIRTDEIEACCLAGGKRRINLDPGYLTEAKVILASTKNYSHRIYLGRGIYAEQEYIFSKGSYRPLAHAYPDYCKKEYIEVFTEARRRFRQLIAPAASPLKSPA